MSSRPVLDFGKITPAEATTSNGNTNRDHQQYNRPATSARSASIRDELLSDGSLSLQGSGRPPSPGLPLHRDPGGMSNLELHDTASGVSSRRRGHGTGGGGGTLNGSTPYINGNNHDEPDYTEKDYLVDREDNDTRTAASNASTSKNTIYSDKEKEKWSKLIPEDLLGGSSSSSRTRRAGTTKHRTGLPGILDFCKENYDIIWLCIYTVLSLFTRLHRIGRSNTVVWDEAHFGKFGAYYLNQTFYFDVHPPLGKMLVGLAGALSGFNGSYDFPSGQTYPDHVPFRAMRIMLAMPGVAMVPLAWGTSIELGFSNYAKHLVTLMTLLDTAWMVISRFILLDSMLLFFTFTTVYFLACFHNQRKYPFSIDWWLWLALTGASIGCVLSVKWIGLFVTSVVGVYTVQDLWDKFGDLRMPIKIYARHWIARGICLILLPASIYMFCFKLHFIILNRSGPGDAQMSSLFQAHLRGNDFAKNPLEAAIGSKLTLKNMGYGGGLLHSHVQTYPVGSQQQQVTCYHYKDSNNDWIVTPTWEAAPYDPEGEIRYLKDGDTIRLVHASTGRNLHSHPVAAPVSKQNHEVSCYGNATVGDSNDYWVVEVVDDLVRGRKEKNIERVHSLTTRIRIRHQNLKCYLRAANGVLPQWGFKQIEVSCDKDNNKGDEHTYWNIESHVNDRLPPGEVKLYRSPFFRDFWHLNVAMWTSNNALVPDPDKDDVIASKPLDWPMMHLGMRMNGWHDTSIKYYLLGHPLTWWFSTLSLPVFVMALIWYLCRFQRKFNDMTPKQWNAFWHAGIICFGGWCFHYLPFFIMGRVTYLHHYLPCLIFAVLNLGFMTDHFVFSNRYFSERTRAIVFWVSIVSIIAVWCWFRATAWGIEGPISEYHGRRWRKTWNIVNP